MTDQAIRIFRRPLKVRLAAPGATRLLSGGACALFLALSLLGLLLAGPQVQADEGSYLLNAAMLAGRIEAHPLYGYYAGYSALLIPAFWLAAQPEGIYHLALTINALLVATTPFALFQLTSTLWPALPARRHAVAALLATCYVPVLVMAQHTMSENALIPLYAWLLATGADMARRGRLASTLAFGALAAYLFLIHVRGAMMALPVFGLVCLFMLVQGRHRDKVLIAMMAACAVGMLHGPLEQLAGRPPQGGGLTTSYVLSRLRMDGAWRWFGFNLAGTTTEAIVTSLGLFIVGLRALATGVRTAIGSRQWLHKPDAALLTGMAIAMVLSLVITAAFFIHPERADQMMYGRYALPTLVPLLAMGALRLQATDARPSRDLLWALGLGAVGLSITAWGYSELPEQFAGRWNYVNAILLFLAHRFIAADSPAMALAIAFPTSFALVWIWLRKSPAAALFAFAAFNVAAFALAWHAVIRPGNLSYVHDRHVINVARAFEAASGTPLCVTMDPGVDAWHRIDFGWRLLPQLQQSAKHRRCARGVIRPLSGAAADGLRLVAIERPSPLGATSLVGLFVETGPPLDAFAEHYELLPADALHAFAAEDRATRIELIAPTLRVAAGATLRVSIRVTNLGGRIFHATDPDLLPYPVLAGAVVPLDSERALNFRTQFPYELGPGESVDMVITIGPVQETGKYPLHIGVVQEHVAWFGGGIDTTLEVTPEE